MKLEDIMKVSNKMGEAGASSPVNRDVASEVGRAIRPLGRNPLRDTRKGVRS